MKREEEVGVVQITDQNRGKVSIIHNGYILNDNGTLSRTPMSETWLNHRNHQMVRRHNTRPKKPEFLEDLEDHPEPTDLDLEWTHEGKWLDVPMKKDGTGAEGPDNRVGRKEPYIDHDGVIKTALCYGNEMGALKVWYKFEDVKKIFPNWVVPVPDRYYNNKRFSNTIRRDLTEGKKKGKGPPIDQSKDDIQGGRGRGRGRGATGYSRGSYQPQNRGRGRDRYDEDYSAWDASQSSGGRTQNGDGFWRTDYGSNNQNNSQEESQNRDSYGYTTKEYETRKNEERKRARSPSPRGERYSRRDRSLERQRERREYSEDRREYRSGYNPGRRSPDRQDRRQYSPDRYERRDHSPRFREERQDSRTRTRREYSPEEGRRYSGHR